MRIITVLVVLFAAAASHVVSAQRSFSKQPPPQHSSSLSLDSWWRSFSKSFAVEQGPFVSRQELESSNQRRRALRFNGHQVWNVSSSESKKQAYLQAYFTDLQESHPQLVDVWIHTQNYILMRVAPSAFALLKAKFSRDQIVINEVVVQDVQDMIDQQLAPSSLPLCAAKKRSSSRTVSDFDALMDSSFLTQLVFGGRRIAQIHSTTTTTTTTPPPPPPCLSSFHESYHTLDEIIDFMDQIVSDHPDIVQKVVIGKTFEGRVITGLQIGINASSIQSGNNFNLPKKQIVFHGGIHAREWIGPATVLYMLDQLIQGYSSNDTETTRLLTTFDWVIIPVLNLDGFVFTHESNRMWRKNRQPNKLPFCMGTDPNRNFGFKWNKGGASSNPCSEAYAGPKAFSTPEATSIAQFIKARSPHVLIYIDFHAFSQLWMYPFGATCQDAPSEVDKIDKAARMATEALANVHGSNFAVGSICNTIYQASGSSIDWTYSYANVTYSYGVELRDTGRYGFLLPPQFIIPSGEETYAAMKALALQVAKQEKL